MLVRLSLCLLASVGPAWAGQICVANPLDSHAAARVSRTLDNLEGCFGLIGSGVQDALLSSSLSDRSEWKTHGDA